MAKEEIMINRLRSRRNRIITIAGCTFIVIILSFALVFVIYQGRKVDALITPEFVRAMVSFEDPKTELSEFFVWFYKLAKYRAITMFYGMYFAMFIGLLISLVIIKIADLTNCRLFISMWDRIHNLEKEIAELKNHFKSEDQL